MLRSIPNVCNWCRDKPMKRAKNVEGFWPLFALNIEYRSGGGGRILKMVSLFNGGSKEAQPPHHPCNLRI